jgi:glycosyltransferase involved in cell wall biosynthesis
MNNGPDDLARRNRELKTEIDRLRLENQTLRIEREQMNDVGRLLRRTVGLGWRELRSRFRRFRTAGGAPAVREQSYDAAFRPYDIRIRQPLQAVRPRVLHAVANLWTGGSARLVVDLIEHLGHKYEQVILARDLPDRTAYRGLPLQHYPELGNPRPIVKVLATYAPRLLHVHYVAHHGNRYSELDWKWYSCVFQAAEQCGCRVIENVNIAVDPFVSAAVDYYVYVSKFVEREFARADSRNVVIYPGSDLGMFSQHDEASHPDDCIGMVYRLEKDKLDERSIDVMIRVVQRRKGTKALVVGGGRFYATFRDAVERAGVGTAFHFTGYVAYADLPKLYKQMSIFVAPVHSESFGQVAPFAMAMGIPVVGYDVGALSEIVVAPELLAPAGDSEKLAEIIVGLLNDRPKRLRIGDANRRRAEELFSVEEMASRYDALYQSSVNSVSFGRTSQQIEHGGQA